VLEINGVRVGENLVSMVGVKVGVRDGIPGLLFLVEVKSGVPSLDLNDVEVEGISSVANKDGDPHKGPHDETSSVLITKVMIKLLIFDEKIMFLMKKDYTSLNEYLSVYLIDGIISIIRFDDPSISG